MEWIVPKREGLFVLSRQLARKDTWTAFRDFQKIESLVARCEVAFFGARDVSAIVAIEIDRPEGAICLEIGRSVG